MAEPAKRRINLSDASFRHVSLSLSLLRYRVMFCLRFRVSEGSEIRRCRSFLRFVSSVGIDF